MKKVIISFAVAAFLISCGGSDAKKAESGEKKEATTDDITKNPDYQKGLDLIAGNDCLTCHKVDEAVTGPSYRDVANKYKEAGDTIVAHLAGKIINGGKGVWGETFMTPHSGMLQEDAEAMVKYILLLKK